MTVKTIKVDYLARVEGEGAIKVVVRDGAVESAEFRIFEPPRFFEALLRGRAFTEAPDITARICGICPVAYQMSTVHAMENAFGLAVTGPLRDLSLTLANSTSAARDAEHRITLNDLVSALEHELHAAEVPECRPPPFDA